MERNPSFFNMKRNPSFFSVECNPSIIPPKLVGTAFGHDPNNMIEYGINCINLKAKHRKLKGYMRNNRKK